MRRAMQGWEELKKHLDTSILVPNQNLFKIANESTGFEQSFELSNDVLKQGVQSVTDLMVRPGLINLDFADVETVMSSMGKAMMGTGEGEGENRALAATELALNNPLIDDYSLKGAKGLLVNITGGDDIKLFEVDQAVNKIRAEVDPEAELIFGAIKDENLNGKMRVSIVATALDGEAPHSKTVLNMVSRMQNRNPGYSDGLFSKSTHIESNALNSISGATALKLEETFESDSQKDDLTNIETESNHSLEANNEQSIDTTSGVSLENASYIENNNESTKISDTPETNNLNTAQEENTPRLFSVDSDALESSINETSSEQEDQSEKLFDQENVNEEEEFEIPAFLRKQKF